MKTLYLIRHAKSSWKDFSIKDHDRPLNKRGKRDAPFMGKLLNKRSIFPDLIVSSTANRALTTAKIIAKEITYPIDKIRTISDIYEASIPDLERVLYGLDDSVDKVFLFGHNPSITYFANEFETKEYIDNVPTCGIVHLEFPIDSWQKFMLGEGKVISLTIPKMFDIE